MEYELNDNYVLVEFEYSTLFIVPVNEIGVLLRTLARCYRVEQKYDGTTNTTTFKIISGTNPNRLVNVSHVPKDFLDGLIATKKALED